MIKVTKPYKDDMIIPIFVSYTEGELCVDVYEEYYDIAELYCERFKDDYFSDTALQFLCDNIKPIGYYRIDDALDYYLVFKNEECASFEVNPDVVDIEDAFFVSDPTEFEAEEIKKYGQPASLIIKDGSIIAICAANYLIEDEDEEVELAVEVLPDYRGRGYAKDVLFHMMKKIHLMGKIPVYRASRYNTASIATAKSCGFKNIGKEYYYNCYQEE